MAEGKRTEVKNMTAHELAGRPAPRYMLANIPRLVTAYYSCLPHASEPAHRVAFGTSGHRGSSFKKSFNETHILAVSQAVCEYRALKKITGPLFIGIDSHAILTHNRDRREGLADGVVITPSHNPPEDGGFKYNPPEGGPAGPDTTGA